MFEMATVTFLAKFKSFTKTELRIVRPELQYYLSQQLLHFLTKIKFYVSQQLRTISNALYYALW